MKIRSSLYVLCALVIASGQSMASAQDFTDYSTGFTANSGQSGRGPSTPTGPLMDKMPYEVPTTTADGTLVQQYQMPAINSGLGASKNIPMVSGGLPSASTALMASPNLLNMVGLPSIPGLPVTGGTYAFGSTQIPIWNNAGYGFSGNNYSVYTGIDSPSGGVVGGLLGGTIGGIVGGITGIASGHYGGILAPVGTGAVNANTTIDNGY